MNEYDSDKISDLMASISFKKTEEPYNADCVIFNTCNIREKAAEKVYSDIGKLKKNFKGRVKPLFILVGCVAQAEGKEIFERSDFVDLIIGPQSYHLLPKKVLDFLKRKEKTVSTEFDQIIKFDTLDNIKPSRTSKVSEFVTVQEGCDKFCSFCVVPYTRGPEFSRSVKSIIAEVKKLSENGVKEIVLLGQNVSAYNSSEEKLNYELTDLINLISEIESISRIRFMTSHPIDISQELIDCFKYQKKLMPFLHLPIQSGSNKILKLMNRKHTKEFYLELIEKIKQANSKIEFSSDFIVGYPGEDEKDFDDTIKVIDKVEFINSYSFIYSQRPGTPAANKNQQDLDVLKERLIILQKKLFEIQLKKNNQMIGQTTQVLIENETKKKGIYFGRNPYFQAVFIDQETKPGQVINTKILSCNTNNLFSFFNEKEKVLAS